MKKQWSTVLLIALVLIVVIFSVMNVDPVNINFGFSMIAIPLVIVIIGTLLIGVLIAVIWSTSIILRERNQQKKLQNQLNDFENQASKEKDQLKEQHQAEKQSLNNDIEKRDTEIRELKRHLQNMKTSHTIKETKPKNDYNI